MSITIYSCPRSCAHNIHRLLSVMSGSEDGVTLEMEGEEVVEVDSMIDRLREFQESLDLELERTLSEEEEANASMGFVDRDDDDEIFLGADDLSASLSNLELSYHQQTPGRSEDPTTALAQRDEFETPSILEKILSSVASTTNTPSSKMYLDEFSVSLGSGPRPSAFTITNDPEVSAIGGNISFFDSPLGLNLSPSPMTVPAGASGTDNSFNRIMTGPNAVPELNAVNDYL